MLGLAVGIDYALFIVSRHRTQLVERAWTPRRPSARAVGTAGTRRRVRRRHRDRSRWPALTVVGIPFLDRDGPRRRGHRRGRRADRDHPAARAARLRRRRMRGSRQGCAAARARPSRRSARAGSACVTRRRVPRRVLVGRSRSARSSMPVLRHAARPARRRDRAPPETTQRKAYDLRQRRLRPGLQRPADWSSSTPAAAATAQVAAADVAQTLGELDDVAAVDAAGRSTATGDTAIAQRHPDDRPDRRRDRGPRRSDPRPRRHARRRAGATSRVTGQTAANIDVSGQARRRAAALPGADRRARVPAADAGVPLGPRAAQGRRSASCSRSAPTFGAVVAVFQWGWLADAARRRARPAPIISFLPILLIGILFGLAMDYQVFLVSRMREEHVHGAAPTRAVVDGLPRTAPASSPPPR